MPLQAIEKGQRAAMAGAEDGFYTKHWRLLVALFWIATAAILLYMRWNPIQWFALGDTDDNMRIMQVRALLAGQDWYDLRQYRLDPPRGANMHWSRLVDLPIAAIMYVLRPLLGGPIAEKVAVAVAPLLPMGVAMAAVAVACRRLISPKAFALGIAILLCAHSARGMWTPLRIDHHGWQLAMLAVAVAALADPRKTRGGLTLGIATALSLVIGLEMLVYLALAGAAVALMWVRDPAHGMRLATYGAIVGGGSALGYLIFASQDNSAPVCDALSPVWLSAIIAAGAAAVGLTIPPLRTPLARLGAGGAAALLIGGGFALAWPQCLGALEGISPELKELWFDNVREVRPIYTHNWGTIAAVVSLPIMGLIGYGVMIWRNRNDEAALRPWAAIGIIALAAAAMLLWQSRAGAPAQLLSVPGAAALAWLLIGYVQKSGKMLVRVFGTVAAFVLVSGIAFQHAVKLVPEKKGKFVRAVNLANSRCPTLAAMKPIAKQPKGYVLTFVDLTPRLIAVTHHYGVAGPYHRNEPAILDTMRTFRGSEQNARRTVARLGIDYVLICPGMSESTIYASEAPKGFYVQLVKGTVPGWLEPVSLPKDSPFRMWRVRR
jgi:hypothetical protein